MIDVKQAIQFAKKFANDLYADENIQHLGLEEVEFDETQQEWLVTLGYDSYRTKQIRPNTMSFAKSLLAETMVENLREYKTFRIDGKDGSFHGMKIREIG